MKVLAAVFLVLNIAEFPITPPVAAFADWTMGFPTKV
jgi:hypothetical protein